MNSQSFVLTVLLSVLVALCFMGTSGGIFVAADCANKTSCGDCVDDSSCVWCTNSSDCRAAQTQGSSDIVIGPVNGTFCGDWQWKQCAVSGKLLIIIIPSVIGGIVLIFGIWLYCCCRRRSKRNFERYLEKVEDDNRRAAEDRATRSEERRAERQVKTDAIRMKYGLFKDNA